jgi:thiamine biosynthesis lipoprotein
LVIHEEPVMGTVVTLQVEAPDLPEADIRDVIGEATKLLHLHDELFSTWKPESPMSRLRRGALDLDDAPSEIAEVLELCATARALSCGWFDPFAMPGGIDPTGLVKGWSAEKALGLFKDAGITSAMVNAGGDIACWGAPIEGGPWRIGIRHPWRADGLACVLEVTDAIATSGEYERGRHLIDPIGRKGPPPAASTVTGPSLAFADAFATAVAVGGDEALAVVASLEHYDVYLIRADGGEAMTSGIRFVDASVDK